MEFVNDNNRFLLAHSEVQRAIDSTMLRYEENILRKLGDGMIQNTTDMLLNITANDAVKRIFSSLYESVEDIVNLAVHCAAAEKTSS